MALNHLATTRDTAAFMTVPSGGSRGWALWQGPTVPWVTYQYDSISLPPGRYRVEAEASFIWYLGDPYERQSTSSEVIGHDTRRIFVYQGDASAGRVVITRLA